MSRGGASGGGGGTFEEEEIEEEYRSNENGNGEGERTPDLECAFQDVVAQAGVRGGKVTQGGEGEGAYDFGQRKEDGGDERGGCGGPVHDEARGAGDVGQRGHGDGGSAARAEREARDARAMQDAVEADGGEGDADDDEGARADARGCKSDDARRDNARYSRHQREHAGDMQLIRLQAGVVGGVARRRGERENERAQQAQRRGAEACGQPRDPRPRVRYCGTCARLQMLVARDAAEEKQRRAVGGAVAVPLAWGGEAR